MILTNFYFLDTVSSRACSFTGNYCASWVCFCLQCFSSYSLVRCWRTSASTVRLQNNATIVACMIMLLRYIAGQKTGTVRLWRSGSTSPSFTSGRVQVYFDVVFKNSNWGNICEDLYFSHSEANVICHQLGYTGAHSYGPAHADRYVALVWSPNPSSGLSRVQGRVEEKREGSGAWALGSLECSRRVLRIDCGQLYVDCCYNHERVHNKEIF